MNWQSRVIGEVQGYKVVDLFPYKISNIDNFLFRDIPNYDFQDPRTSEKAREIWRDAVEGRWINDNGHWVWMLPKAYFYANLSTVLRNVDDSKNREEGYPDLRDNEWIIFSYLACVDGFSGFENDEHFTCNKTMLRVGSELKLPPRAMARLEAQCRRPDGKWKEYIDPWNYLTEHYLVANPAEEPLGRAIYGNPTSNGMIMGSRKTGKTYTLAAGDAAHEFWTNGAMTYEELARGGRVNMFVGSSDSNFLGTFVTTLQTAFTMVPGKGHENHPFFTKTATDSWNSDRDPVIQKYRTSDGKFKGSFSEIAKAVILPNKSEAVVSKRCKRIYIDECGLQTNFKRILAAAEATMKSDADKFGALLASGTGGNVDRIAETKEVFTHPEMYGFYPIPNYWRDGKSIGLFLSVALTLRDYKDRHGNTDLMAATEAVLAYRFERSEGDISKITDLRMNEPLEPLEIFLAGKSTHFDKDLILDRISVLEDLGEWKRQCRVYDLELGPKEDIGYRVIATVKPNAWNNVITDISQVDGKTGELVVAEPPMPDGRRFLDYNNLYKVVYDPKQDLPDGPSFACIHVYKGKPQRALEQGELFNTIVATAKVNITDGDHTLFMLLCLWYGAKGQYERNVSGIPKFFEKYGLRWVLQRTPYEYIKDNISPTSKQQYDSGIFMTTALKSEARGLLKKHHRGVVNIDELGTVFRQVDFWYSLEILHEMLQYDDEGNFDAISAIFILMLWLQAEFDPNHQPTETGPQEYDPYEELASAININLSY